MKILFQGDSITDAGRNRNAGSVVSIGQGYPLLIDARLSVDGPGKYEFINLGISGNRVVDVYARIKCDCWNHEPDVLSILIGVNDVWHEVSHHNGVEADRFETVYRMLLRDTLARFPQMKILLMEPFVLHGAASDGNWEYFETETARRAEITKALADELGLFFLPLQKRLSEAALTQPASYWLRDGVHPTPAGHQMIADAWIDLFEQRILPAL
jgi:lysophospholipase L1-like esterase